LSLTQGNLRKLVNLEETVNNMLTADRVIDNQHSSMWAHDTMVKELEEFMRR
jgi:hypothetical protein